MKAFTATLMCACMTLAAGSVAAADDGMTKTPDNMAKGDMMKKDAMCDDMMKKNRMKKDAMSGEAMDL